MLAWNVPVLAAGTPEQAESGTPPGNLRRSLTGNSRFIRPERAIAIAHFLVLITQRAKNFACPHQISALDEFWFDVDCIPEHIMCCQILSVSWLVAR